MIKISPTIVLYILAIFSCKHSPETAGSQLHSAKTNLSSDVDTLYKIENRFRFLPNSSKGLLKEMGPSGSFRYNRKCDNGTSKPPGNCRFYIEEQRKGYIILYAGLYHKNNELIEGGLKIIKWGFSMQDHLGGFSKSIEPFHSSSFFIDAAAHSLLILDELDPERAKRPDIRAMVESLVKALEWFISEPLWSKGLRHNYAMAHRHFVVASAIGLSLKAAERYNVPIKRQVKGDAIIKMNSQLAKAVSRLKPNGIMPELGGYDSSYQMAGVLWGSYWLSYFNSHHKSSEIKATLLKMSDWQLTRIESNGKVLTRGNKRTAGQETGRTGVSKKVDYKMVIKALYYMEGISSNSKYRIAADKVAKMYYKK